MPKSKQVDLPEDQTALVKMRHPDLDGPISTTTVGAFSEIWSDKGWVLATEEEVLDEATAATDITTSEVTP